MELSPLSILLVDDEPSVRATLAAILRKDGCHVTDVNDASEALAALRTKKFDLLLTDYRMPGMDGIELLAAVRQQFPGTTGIVMSGYGPLELEMEEAALGDLECLAKPTDIVSLKESIRRAVARNRHPGSRKESSMRLTVIDLKRVITETVALFRVDAQARGVHLCAEPLHNAAFVQTDENRLREMAEMIVHRAIHLTPSGGHVLVSIHSLPESRQYEVKVHAPEICGTGGESNTWTKYRDDYRRSVEDQFYGVEVSESEDGKTFCLRLAASPSQIGAAMRAAV